MGQGDRALGFEPMRAVVLETDVLGTASQSTYADSLTSYQFPSQYLGNFELLSTNADMLAIIYEPRGQSRSGRMSYVGWGIIRGVPIRDPNSATLRYTVKFLEPLRSFDRAVPREIDGEPVERSLREIPRGNLRNVATFGRAIRGIEPDDVETILRYGSSDPLWVSLYDDEDGSQTPDGGSSRVRRLVTRLDRNVQFSKNVLGAYGRRCAVSGLAAGGHGGLIEAAHIKPVGSPHFGPDDIKNGIALTPTLHRLFDRSLFSLKYVGDNLVVVTSSQLSDRMVHDTESGSGLRLECGQKVRLPTELSLRPDRRFVNHHRRSLLP